MSTCLCCAPNEAAAAGGGGGESATAAGGDEAVINSCGALHFFDKSKHSSPGFFFNSVVFHAHELYVRGTLKNAVYLFIVHLLGHRGLAASTQCRPPSWSQASRPCNGFVETSQSDRTKWLFFAPLIYLTSCLVELEQKVKLAVTRALMISACG